MRFKKPLYLTTALCFGIFASQISLAIGNTVLSEYNYYEQGKKALNSSQFQNAIDHYEKLLETYPNSEYVKQAQLERAFAYHKLGDANKATEVLRAYITNFPDHPHVPYAYYLMALSRYHEALNMMEASNTQAGLSRISWTTQQALNYFGVIVDKFSDSEYNNDAKQKTTYLLEKLVLHRIKLAELERANSRQSRIETESKESSDWILEQPANYYTLQLIKDGNYNIAFNVATQYKLQDDATIIETHNEEGKAYTLLFGIYPDKRSAMEAGSKLPGAILDVQPWVRDLASLHNEIRESRLIVAGLDRKQSQPEVSLPAAVEPSPAKVIQPTIAEHEKGTAGREAWLLKQSPKHFTVQLSGASNEENILAYIDHYNLAGKVAYYQSSRKGKPWFSLLYGSYANRQAAIDAGNEIKGALGIGEPWIRSFAGVHSDINKSQ